MSVDYAKVKEPARKRVLALLSDLQVHNWRAIHRVGGVRYSARILELKRLGYKILSWGNEHGKDYQLKSLRRSKPQGKHVKIFLDERDAEKLFRYTKKYRMPKAARQFEDALGSYRENIGKL